MQIACHFLMLFFLSFFFLYLKKLIFYHFCLFLLKKLHFLVKKVHFLLFFAYFVLSSFLSDKDAHFLNWKERKYYGKCY